MKQPTTPLPPVKNTKRDWHVLDASSATLGRVAAQAAALLTGKHRSDFSTHVDAGDFVVIVNADQLQVTGNKLQQKKYYRYSGYPGGMYEKTLEKRMINESDEVIRDAVKGMLGKNRLRRGRLARLKIYKGSDHPHTDAKQASSNEA